MSSIEIFIPEVPSSTSLPIFKYMTSTVAKMYLNSEFLKYSSTLGASINDAFEFQPRVDINGIFGLADYYYDTPANREISRSLRESLLESFRDSIGVLCFSLAEFSPAMWGLYAENSTGVMLEFDPTHHCFDREHPSSGNIFGRVLPVSYTKTRPKLRMHPLCFETIEHAFLTKSDIWRTEQEARLLWPLDTPDSINTSNGNHLLYKIPFAALRSITFGANSTGQMEIRAILNETETFRHVAVRQSEMDHDSESYEFTYRLINIR